MKTCPTCRSTHPSNYAVCPQDGTALIDVEMWSDGTVIRGKYRIVNKVGQGGMGAVYKALHLAFDEVRALKVISLELMRDDLFVKRFKHEAVITRKLQHPNAVRVDDIDEAEDGRPFIVMEFIEGRSLKKLIQEKGPLPAARICAIIKQTAAALEAAHQLGMVHRDIKPENIVLVEMSQGEQAKVLDFGIAKVKEARLGGTASGMTLTGTGVVIGTPQYMSPEQAMGKRGDELDGRSDIYSLGIVMYQMLTGELPFQAETTMEMLLAHLQRPPTPIQTQHPELKIPEALANLVMKCLEKKRELRPASAKALIGEIERAEKQPGPAVPSEALRSTIVASADMLRAAASPPAASPQAEPLKNRPAAPPAQVTPGPPVRPVAPPPAPKPPPAVGAAQLPPQVVVSPPSAVRSRPSRWGLWTAAGILLFGLAGLAWYANQRPSSETAGDITGTIHDSKGGVVSGASVTAIRRSTGESVNNAGSGTTGVYAIIHLPPDTYDLEVKAQGFDRTTVTGVVLRPGRETSQDVILQPEQRALRPEELKPVSVTPVRGGDTDQGLKKTSDSERQQKVSSSAKLGDFYLKRGDYEAAIGAYKEGLSADPSNATLQQKIQQAKKAKAAEEEINK